MSAILLPYRGGVLLTTAWSVSERYEGGGVVVSFAHDCGNPFTSPREAAFPRMTMTEFLSRVQSAHKEGLAFVDFSEG